MRFSNIGTNNQHHTIKHYSCFLLPFLDCLEWFPVPSIFLPTPIWNALMN